MAKLEDVSRWPEVAPELKYKNLNLPGTFRELCANQRFSNEELGRIIRCIAMGTDAFLTPRIEPEVFFYRKVHKEREYNRQRVAKSRRKSRGEEPVVSVPVTEQPKPDIEQPAISSPPPNPVQPESIEQVKPVESAEPAKSVELAKSVNSVEPVEVIDPAQAEQPVSQSKSGLPVQKRFVPRTVRVPRVDITNETTATRILAGDLFSLMEDPCAPRRQQTVTVVPAKASTTGVSDAAVTKPQAIPDMDSRVDLSWIPVKFNHFWKRYPRKVAKQDAVKAFTKIIKEQRDADKFMDTLFKSLDFWMTQEQWTKDKGKFIPYPASWLNAGHWKDSEDNDSMYSFEQARQPTYLKGDQESDDDLLRRMTGG